MENLITNSLMGYWTPQELVVNLNIFLNAIGALALGLLVGYERFYRGRAAGMRTYGLVCMSACALTVMSGSPEYWYGGHIAASIKSVDPSRVIQGIITGVGFLGTGVILRDGLSISGLTTAALIWVVAAIGVLVGAGFYSTAIMMALLASGCMMWGTRIENMLPARHAIAVTLHFHKDVELTEGDLTRLMRTQGYEVAHDSFSITLKDQHPEWRFVAVSQGRKKSVSFVKLSESLKQAQDIKDFTIAHARN